MLCGTISNDHSVKIYDVVNYDMMVMIRLPYVPGAVEWVYKQGEVKAKIAISDRDSSFVRIYDARAGTNEPLCSREVISAMKIILDTTSHPYMWTSLLMFLVSLCFCCYVCLACRYTWVQ